jgi:RNA polymerase sigma factor (sigma-70 family)
VSSHEFDAARRKRITSSAQPADTSPTDEALLAGMASRDDASTVAFVRRYQRRVFGLAIGIVGDAGAAEDVAQEAMLRAWRHAPVFDPRRGSVETWVLTIAKNLSIDALRKRRAVPTDPDDLVALARAAHGTSPEELAASNSMGAVIVAALGAIPAEQRRAVVMASLYGKTAQEISDIENIPLGTSKTRIRAGLLKLRSVLESSEGGIQ